MVSPCFRNGRRRRRRDIAAVLAAVVVVTLTQRVPALADPPGHAPRVAADRSVPVHAVAGHYRTPVAMPKWQAAPPTWPSGEADVDVTTTARQAGSLPVHVGTPVGRKDAAGAGGSGRVHVRVASRQAADAAGVDGVLLSVAGTDNGGPVQVSLDYGSFAGAFGGDWPSRLRLVEMPACALTTPTASGCTSRKPVTYHNDPASRTLSADLTLPSAAGRAATPEALVQASSMVLAADASSGGGTGDFSATSLQPSGSWQAGGSSDGFTWSYPVPTPNVPGGLVPTVSLSYSSQSVDGLTSGTNNQASWIGDGWDYHPGFIERSYQTCHDDADASQKTWDNCWSNDNQLTFSFNGSSSTLIKDDATGQYHPADDANEKVEYLTGANNGAQNGEYFQVTTPDGTRYIFGLNQLPGWASGNAVTNSVWTEPVFAPKSGQPCYNSTWANSWCQQAYRWNLDEVIDTHGDTVAYFYRTESNYYARNLGTTADTSYTRGGYLWQIWYGQRNGSQYSTTPAGQVTFTVNGRCNTAPTGCDVSTLSTSTASSWPDVPYDLNCAQGAACSSQSPTFWSEYELTGIQTQALNGGGLANVDSWALAHSFPATGEAAGSPQTAPALWLDSVTRTGQDAAGTGPTAAITLPPVVFTGTPLANRVSLADGFAAITRRRLNTITTETGETISVDYSQAICATCAPSDPSSNTALAYPSYWTRPGETDPRIDWFNKYVVTHVTEQDGTGGPPGSNDTIVTTYTPVGSPAWHYDDDPLTPAKRRSWNQWRGFAGMTVSTGTAPDPVTRTVYTYLRGMDGDTLPNNGTRHVTVTDSRGDPAVTDSDQYAGMTYETQVFSGSSLMTDTIDDPWASPATAAHALSGGLPTQHAFHTGQAAITVYTPLASGATRQTRIQNGYDSYGRVVQVDDQGDASTAADDLCTTTSYTDNTGAWILDLPAEVKKTSVNCGVTNPPSSALVSDELTFYDGATTLGAVPAVGDLTMSQDLISAGGGSPTYATTQKTVDQYGRVLTATDANGNKTTTSYSPAAGGPTKMTVTDPMRMATTTTYDPLRGVPLTITDRAGYVTTRQYDALGRVTAVYKPGRTVGTNPNAKYSYVESNTAPSVVTTYTLTEDPNAPFRAAVTLYDSMLRTREVQTQTPDNGRVIVDTTYNTDGWQSVTTSPYFNASPVSSGYVEASAGQVDAETGYLYDGAGRKTDAISYRLGTETWRTSYLYGGNFTTTIPPAGGTRTTSVTDARGRQTHLIRYRSAAPADYLNDRPSDYTDTVYTFAPAGMPATMTDPTGNVWAWSYDLLGRKTDAYDPDAGHTVMTYDNVGNLLTSTNVTDGNKQTTYTYDKDNRRTGSYDTTSVSTLSTSNQIGGWAYDTVKKGLPSSVTSYSAGDVYTRTVLGYNNMALPAATKVTLTGPDAALLPAGGVTTSYGYSITGRLSNQDDPAEGGLPEEDQFFGADAFGELTSLSSIGGASWNYVSAVGYNHFAQPVQYTMPTAGGTAWTTLGYDPQTRDLTEVKVDASTASGDIDDLAYGFGNATVSKGAGLLTSIVDKRNAATIVDTQCFGYDDFERLSQAWTATDNCAAAPRPGNSQTVGGPVAPYWQSWTYNDGGQRTTQTDHDPAGNTANDATTTYHYPVPTTDPTASTQPDTLTSISTTGPSANTATYTYDPSGNLATVTAATGGNQTYTWTDQGKLATTRSAVGTTAYVYDAEGNLLARRNPGSTTLYLGDTQIVRDTSTGTITGTRYLSLGGVTVAARRSNNTVVDLVPDRQGTTEISINTDASQAVTRRQYLPFGQSRGTAGAFPGDKGWVGGTTDTATSLVNLGAREYDSQTGRFLSADPVLHTDDPNQFNGYDYAGNNPVTHADPTGLDPDNEGPCGGFSNGSCPSSNSSAQWAIGCNGENGGCHPVVGVPKVPAATEPPAPKPAKKTPWWKKAIGVAVTVISVAAPIITAVAIATSFIPGVDVLTGGLALLVDAISIAASVLNVASTAISLVNTVNDFRDHKSGSQKAADAASFALGAIGAKTGGWSAFTRAGSGLIRGAKDVAAGVSDYSARVSTALNATRDLAQKGGAAGRAASAALPEFRQAKNAALALRDVGNAFVPTAGMADNVINGAGAVVSAIDDAVGFGWLS